MKRNTKETLFNVAIYSGMIAASLLALLTAYSAIYFAHHDSAYAEACPEQKTLFFCKSEKE